MKSKSLARTPFDEGTRSAQPDCDDRNPHVDGSVEYRNFELGRQYGLRNLKVRATYLPPRPHA